jgi:hypothetical protein
MLNSKLYNLFARLSAAQKREIRGFIALPLVNQRAEVLRLWAFLENAKSDKPDDFDRKKAFQAVFDAEKLFEEQPLRHVQSWLLTAIEKYLAYRNFSENEALHDLHLAKAYQKLRLSEQQQQVLQNVEKTLNKTQNSPETLHLRYQIECDRYEILTDNQRKTDLNLTELGYTLDAAFVVNKLREACYTRAHEAVSKQQYRVRFLENVLQQIENEPIMLAEPLIAAYHWAYQLAISVEQAQDAIMTAYPNFKKIVLAENTKTTLRFTQNVQHELWIAALNFCIKNINSGQNEFYTEILIWYKYGLSAEILLKNNEISPFTYRNIVTAACRCAEFDWVKIFVKEYKNKLPAAIREATYDLNLARLLYEAHDFEAALPILARFSSDDSLQNFAAKTLLLKMLFEMQEIDALETHLSSFAQYIRRKGVKTGYHQANYENIIRFTRKIIYTHDKTALHELENEIKTTTPLTEKNWLLKQIDLQIND